jgi:hypothetical protein
MSEDRSRKAISEYRKFIRSLNNSSLFRTNKSSIFKDEVTDFYDIDCFKDELDPCPKCGSTLFRNYPEIEGGASNISKYWADVWCGNEDCDFKGHQLDIKRIPSK